MASQQMTASDGTVFVSCNQGNGDYIAVEDDRGFHHAPPRHKSLPDWSDEEARRQLRRAVREHERRLESGDID